MLKAFYTAQVNPRNNLIVQTYISWRNLVGKEVRRYIDANILTDVRRDIIKVKGLTGTEISQIRIRIFHRRPNENSNTVDEIGNKCTESNVNAVHPNERAEERIAKKKYAEKEKVGLPQEHQTRIDMAQNLR